MGGRYCCLIVPFLFSLLLMPTGCYSAQHSDYPAFAEPDFFWLDSGHLAFSSPTGGASLSVTASDDAVYRYGYLSPDGNEWQRFTLSGEPLGGDWLNGSVSAQVSMDASDFGLSQDRLSTQRNFVVIYSCSRSGGAWDCHEGWQIWQFNASIEEQDPCSGMDCDDSDPCTIDSCESGQCVHDDVTCADSDGCCPSGCTHDDDDDCAVQLPSGMLYWWKLDGDAQDSVGNNHGTLSSQLYTASSGCKSGQCYLFDTNGDYVALSTPFTLSTGTYSFWISRGDISDDRIIMGNDGYHSRIFLTTGGYVRMETDTNQQEFEFWSSVIPQDTPTHVILSRSGNSLSLYVNGDFVTTTTVYGASPLTVSQIGMNGRSFRGSIDEVMVWDRALSASEVSQVYHYFDGPPPEPECGNGIVEPPEETCDGNCPSSCGDGNPCTVDTMTGSAADCDVVCSHTLITSCTGGDGCCPSGCSEPNDGDCTAPSIQLLEIGSDSRHLVYQDGTPFFMNGDTAWSLIAQLTKADADFYLQNRAQMGFNLVLVNLIEHEYSDNAPANIYGDAPFTGKTFTTPNEAYFAHADYVIASAAQNDLYVLLDPLYLGWGCGSSGWCDDVYSASESDMLSWGRYVGNRYKDYDNIIWLIGGDVDPPAATKPKIEKMVEGILEYDQNHLLTAHNVRGQMAVDPWPDASWLNVNDVYTAKAELCANSKRAYDYSPTMPFFLLEAIYENDRGGLPASEARSQAYWTVLSGGFGHIFGNCPLWGFGTTAASSFCAETDWKAQLGRVGSADMIRFRNLFESRDWSSLVPDFSHSVLTTGYGTLGQMDYATAAYTTDRSTFIAYMPTQRTITVNTGTVSGSSIRSWWYNPRDGTSIELGTAAKASSRAYTTPTSSGPDWVLVIDDASASYGPPG